MKVLVIPGLSLFVFNSFFFRDFKKGLRGFARSWESLRGGRTGHLGGSGGRRWVWEKDLGSMEGSGA